MTLIMIAAALVATQQYDANNTPSAERFNPEGRYTRGTHLTAESPRTGPETTLLIACQYCWAESVSLPPTA